MRDYRLYEMSDEGFEKLIGYICSHELGTGTVIFAKGPDGGRDGRFEGTAKNYPSPQSPWSGKFIIQAKHTASPIASCSDNDFESNKSSVINKEIKRIKNLCNNGEVDNYLLFTNRKQSGDADEHIRSKIREETGVKKVALIGMETIHLMITKHHKEATRLFHLDQLRGPLIFHSQELKIILTALSKQKIMGEIDKFDYSLDFVSIEEKNRLNQLSEKYFKHIKDRSLPYFGQIKHFLNNPVNIELTALYDNIIAEFNNKILIRRDDFDKFEEIFEVLYDTILDEEPRLHSHKRLLFTLLHFMYWECDLGEKC